MAHKRNLLLLLYALVRNCRRASICKWVSTRMVETQRRNHVRNEIDMVWNATKKERKSRPILRRRNIERIVCAIGMQILWKLQYVVEKFIIYLMHHSSFIFHFLEYTHTVSRLNHGWWMHKCRILCDNATINGINTLNAVESREA